MMNYSLRHETITEEQELMRLAAHTEVPQLKTHKSRRLPTKKGLLDTHRLDKI